MQTFFDYFIDLLLSGRVETTLDLIVIGIIFGFSGGLARLLTEDNRNLFAKYFYINEKGQEVFLNRIQVIKNSFKTPPIETEKMDGMWKILLASPFAGMLSTLFIQVSNDTTVVVIIAIIGGFSGMKFVGGKIKKKKEEIAGEVDEKLMEKGILDEVIKKDKQKTTKQNKK